MNPRSKRVCSLNGCEADLHFAVKAMMKEKSFTAIFISVGATILLFGYQVHVFEGPISDISKQDLNDIFNAMWLIIVTLTTVGFGDFYLKTWNGRIVGFIACFWGTFVVSCFVVTVTNILTFSAPEEKSYILLQRLHYKESLKEYAVNVLSSAFRHKVKLIEH